MFEEIEIKVNRKDLEQRANTSLAKIIIVDEDGKEALFFISAGIHSNTPKVELVSKLPKDQQRVRAVSGQFKEPNR